MEQPTTTSYSVSDIVQWDYSQQISLTPKFQRGKVWSLKAKSYLIDTIMKGMPIPPIYIRPILDVEKMRSVREIVDGQQRINTILEFVQNKFSIMSIHNKELGNLYFGDLNDECKYSILSYKFTASLLDNISDTEVLEIFARINTYTVPLNQQELRNSKYFGVFKQMIYRIAHRHYKFFVNNGIISDTRIARMDDAAMISELISASISGISDTNNNSLNKLYERFDDSFDGVEAYEEAIFETFNYIAEIFNGNLKKSNFKRRPLFYSIFFICLTNLFENNALLEGRVVRRSDSVSIQTIRRVVSSVDEGIKNVRDGREWQTFFEAVSKGTASAKTRSIRDAFLRKMIEDEQTA